MGGCPAIIVLWMIVAIFIRVGIEQLAWFMAVKFLMKSGLLFRRLGAALGE
jgi:hypothetical protein